MFWNTPSQGSNSYMGNLYWCFHALWLSKGFLLHCLLYYIQTYFFLLISRWAQHMVVHLFVDIIPLHSGKLDFTAFSSALPWRWFLTFPHRTQFPAPCILLGLLNWHSPKHQYRPGSMSPCARQDSTAGWQRAVGTLCLSSEIALICTRPKHVLSARVQLYQFTVLVICPHFAVPQLLLCLIMPLHLLNFTCPVLVYFLSISNYIKPYSPMDLQLPFSFLSPADCTWWFPFHYQND